MKLTPSPAADSHARNSRAIPRFLMAATLCAPLLSAWAQSEGPGPAPGPGRGMGHQSLTERYARANQGREMAPSRDLLQAFGKELRKRRDELGIGASQAPAFDDFVRSVEEVGKHNERRLMRLLGDSKGTLSAAAPIEAYIGSEVEDGEDRQQALLDLKQNHQRLLAVLDQGQRTKLSEMFNAVRADLAAPKPR
jgi:hypothetical protein